MNGTEGYDVKGTETGDTRQDNEAAKTAAAESGVAEKDKAALDAELRGESHAGEAGDTQA